MPVTRHCSHRTIGASELVFDIGSRQDKARPLDNRTIDYLPVHSNCFTRDSFGDDVASPSECWHRSSGHATSLV